MWQPTQDKPVQKDTQNKHFHMSIKAWVCLQNGYVAFASSSQSSDNICPAGNTHLGEAVSLSGEGWLRFLNANS